MQLPFLKRLISATNILAFRIQKWTTMIIHSCAKQLALFGYSWFIFNIIIIYYWKIRWSMESILTHLVHRFQAKVVRMAYLNVPRNIVFALSTHNMDGAWAHNSYFTSNGFVDFFSFKFQPITIYYSLHINTLKTYPVKSAHWSPLLSSHLY